MTAVSICLLMLSMTAMALNYQHSLQLFQENCSMVLGLPSSLSAEDQGYSRVTNSSMCPPWWHQSTSADGRNTCIHGPNLPGIEHYYPTMQTMLSGCNCMTEENGVLTVGTCLYTCNAIYDYYPLPCHISKLNSFTCEGLNRTGRLCGDCLEGYAPPVYSYDLKCVKCENYHWLKYLTAAFLPLTLFFLIVTIFSISFTSPRVCGVVLVYQLMANPTQLRVLVSLSDSGLLLLHKNTVTSIVAVWNLDFFRMAYKAFCLHPEMTTLHTLALDYAIAVYPLFLIVLTYVIVTLYDRGFRPVKWIADPIIMLSKKLKHHCNAKTSLIDVFASFIFLSTARLLSTSFILLVPSSSYSLNTTSLQVTLTQYVYNAPNVKYFSKEHLPFAITAIIIVVLLNLLPMMLLFAYPFKSFQNLLKKKIKKIKN